MPLIDINNPAVIKFLNESYEKTDKLRMKWNHLYGEKLKEAATLKREAKGYFEEDVIKEAMIAGMPTITRDYKSGARNRRKFVPQDGAVLGVSELKKGHSLVDVGLGDPKIDPILARPDDDLSIDPIMRPVPHHQSKIIYKGLPNFGSAIYIKVRNKMNPEDKYYLSPTGNCDYGWRLKDSFFSRTAPQFGNVWRLTHDLEGRSGCQPDPDHYKSAEPPNVNKCSLD